MADRIISVRLQAIIADYQQKMAQASETTRRFGSRVTQAAHQNSAGFTTLGLAVGAAGAAITASLGASVKSAIDFESSFAGVRKTVNATEPEFAALAAGFRDLATEIPVSVNELNRIGEAAGQLGIQTPNILGFSRVIADLGVTTNLASDEAATALARLANITQMPQENFDRLGATIVDLGNNLATTEAEIVDFGLRIAGAGKIAGLTEAEILGIGAAMSSVGVQAEAGGTAVQKVLLGITNAVAQGSDKLATFAQAAGMSAQEFSQAWRTDAGAAFTDFVEGLGRAGNDAFVILDQLDLTDQRLIRSFLSLAGAGDVLRQSMELGTEAWEENTALVREAEQRYDTTASKIQIFKNQLNELAINIGEVLLPVVGAMVEHLADVAGFFADLPAPVQAAAVGVGALAGGVGVLAGGLLLLLPRIAATRIALTDLGIAGGRAGTALGFLGRAGMWAAGIGAVVTAASLMHTQLDRLTRGTAKLSELTGALLDLNDGADAMARINELARGGQKDLRFWADRFEEGSGRSHMAGKKLKSSLEDIDDALVGIVQSGAADQAAEIIEHLARRSGVSVDTLLVGLDDYQTSLQETEVQTRLTGDAALGLADDLEEIDPAAQAAAEALAQLYEDLGAGVGAFTDGMEAVDTVMERLETEARKRAEDAADAYNRGLESRVEGTRKSAEAEARAIKDSAESRARDIKRAADDHVRAAGLEGDAARSVKEAAEDQARAVKDAADDKARALSDGASATAETLGDEKRSWEDYAETVQLTMADVIAELEAQVEAQMEWRKNLATIAERGRADVAEELAKLGPEGARMVAAFANATDAEFDKASDLWVQSVQDGTDETGKQLQSGFTVMAELGRQGASATVISIATALGMLPGEIARILAEAGREVQLGLPNLFGPVQTSVLNMPNLFGPPGRATGGSVTGGMYEVNEKGDPELLTIANRQFLMMPPQNGYVTPLSGGSLTPAATGIDHDKLAQALSRSIGSQGVSVPINVYPSEGMSESALGEVTARYVGARVAMAGRR